MSGIRCEALSKSYRRIVALDGVDLEIEPGSFTVLCGPPGAGKSVLLRLLIGLEAPSAGRIRFDNHDITDLPAARRTIGYVPQSFALFPHMSVFDNIAYPLALQGVARQEIEQRLGAAADVLRIRHLLLKRPSQLSGGEKQRAAVARGLLKNADIFILDDPLVGLDFKLRESLMEDLKDMRAQLGATFLYATSDPLEALIMAERLVVMDQGRVVESNFAESVYHAPRHLRAAELVGFPRCSVVPGTLDGDMCTTVLGKFPIERESNAGGDTVSVVIRPEHIAYAPENGAAALGRVSLMENLGAECVVYFVAENATLVTTVPSLRVPDLAPGAPFPFAISEESLLVFDRASGARIGCGRTHDA